MIPKDLAPPVTQILRDSDLDRPAPLPAGWHGPGDPGGWRNQGVCASGDAKITVAMKNIGSAAKAARAITGSTKAIAAAAG